MPPFVSGAGLYCLLRHTQLQVCSVTPWYSYYRYRNRLWKTNIDIIRTQKLSSSVDDNRNTIHIFQSHPIFHIMPIHHRVQLSIIRYIAVIFSSKSLHLILNTSHSQDFHSEHVEELQKSFCHFHALIPITDLW